MPLTPKDWRDLPSTLDPVRALRATDRGAWSSGTSYDTYDVVTHSGASYIAKGVIASGGANPSANSSWALITPLDAAALEDLETRLGAYADSTGGGGSSDPATTTTLGIVKLSATPADPDNPVVIEEGAFTSALAAKQDASTAATDAELSAHAADTTSVHGIADTSVLVVTSDTRLSDERVPTDGSVTAAKVNAALKPSGSAAASDESLRRLGTGATHAAAGDDSRFPSTGEKNALAGTSGTPGSGNKYVTDGDARNSDTRTPTDASVTDAKIASTLSQSKITNLVSDLAAKQPLDSDLTALAALTTTSFGRALLELADAAAGRTALAAAPLASPALTGNPTAPTPSQGDNDTSIATTAYVQTEAGLLVPKSLVDAKGDLLVGSADNAVARLAVGSDGHVLTADAASTNGIKWAAASGGAAGTYVTSLPGSPTDGQEIFYAADATNGVIWHLRYRSGASGSYKWEFLGGPPLTADADMGLGAGGPGTKTSGAYGTLTGGTAGPSITNPLAGDWMVGVAFVGTHNTSGGQLIMSFSIGAGTASDATAAVQTGGSVTNIFLSGSREVRCNGLAASQAITAKYKTNTGTVSFYDKQMWLLPVRVG